MQTSVIKKSISIALAGLILSTASMEVMAVQVRGARSCGQWIELRKTLDAVEAVAQESWFVGYLSGMAAYSDTDILKGTDNPSIFLWLDNYCRAKPLKRIDDAGDELFLELKKQKRL